MPGLRQGLGGDAGRPALIGLNHKPEAPARETLSLALRAHGYWPSQTLGSAGDAPAAGFPDCHTRDVAPTAHPAMIPVATRKKKASPFIRNNPNVKMTTVASQ